MPGSRRVKSLRDRHGRGARGPRLFPGLPAWRTRRQSFDALVASIIADFTRRWPAVASVEFATEEVPPSDPAPWDSRSVVLAQVFPMDRRRGLKDRIVIYRLPIMLRCTTQDVAQLTRAVIADRLARVLAIPPDELDDALGNS
ncbi:metallopeptidase family protein [Schaalia sp. ZJ405]|uniref:metallopeptidase family protein n=1 Tax=Schaalia sp. ZJ405 TaxID=2709403 RepID=UPI001E2AB5FC|nr:metallopeptidase family protein [Schaalia sp. ZJ405]